MRGQQMEFKVIGEYGRYPAYNKATNCYLIKTDNGKNILIDLGSGALSLLQKHIDISKIDVVIITHLHFDHACDLGVLSYSIGYLGLNKIKVYMPATPELIKNVFNSSKFDVQIIYEDLQFSVDNINFTFAYSPHPVETYSVIMKYNDKKIVYTSDCSKKEIIAKNTLGADIVIGDACILHADYKSNSPHVSVKDLAESVPENCKLYLAHLTCGQEKEILQEGIKHHKNTELVKGFLI